MEKIFMTQSENETAECAKKLAQYTPGGSVIVLIGELGAGKTAFVRGFCEPFGISGISSPTFTIVNEYIGSVKIYHIDAYRLKVDDIGLYEYFEDKNAISLVEWGGTDMGDIVVELVGSGDDARHITIRQVREGKFDEYFSS
jgi:tRNA threonylcarbamoyladenosine biosynthesis protein TsaE